MTEFVAILPLIGFYCLSILISILSIISLVLGRIVPLSLSISKENSGALKTLVRITRRID